MRVLVCGSSGLLGCALASDLAARGDVVWTLDRHARGTRGLAWPDDAADAAALASRLPPDLDAVVQLSGSPILRWPWTRAVRAEIRASRVAPTRQLACALAENAGAGRGRPRLLAGSAIGLYRPGWPAVGEDEGAMGEGFLAELCRDWEAAAAPAAAAGLSVAILRTGLVLDPAGGLLGRLLPLARRGLLARVGAADLPWSWIHRDDWLGAARFILDRGLAGPFNLCAPSPRTQAAALAELGRLTGRRPRLALPALPLAALGGRMAREVLLRAPAARPARLLAAGYTFLHPELGPALAALLEERP